MSLDLKKQMNRKHPVFKREDAFKHKEVKSGWRKPKGLQSKLRRGMKGALVQIGYGTPRSVRHLDVRTGLLPVRIFTVADLGVLNAKKHGAVIAASVGNKSRIALVKTAAEKGITIMNMKDPQGFEKRINEALAEKKKQKKEKKKSKDAAKPKEKKVKKEDRPKQEEKKELDKLLTKK